MYDDSECGETLSEFEGFVNSSMISKEKIDYVTKHGLQLDCMWVIEVAEDWKVCFRSISAALTHGSLYGLIYISLILLDPIKFRPV